MVALSWTIYKHHRSARFSRTIMVHRCLNPVKLKKYFIKVTLDRDFLRYSIGLLLWGKFQRLVHI